jgi:trans-2,3-dihydro-3-hydroxyanthranilate isomerase
MPTYELLQVDAFTDKPLCGNPCAVVFDTDDMETDRMQEIAKEMNLSETAFVQHSSRAHYKVRFFTPAEEIPLAGHPTIATIYALIDTKRLTLRAKHTKIQLELREGPIDVEIISNKNIPDQNEVSIQKIVMAQRKPRFLTTHSPDVIMPIFGLTSGDLIPGVPIQTVSTGTPQLMILVRDIKTLTRVRMDILEYSIYRATHDFFSPHLFCLEGFTSRGQTFARHFGVPPDTPEDPFTGSATGGMAAYLWHYRLIESPRFMAEQGHWMSRPGEACVEIIGPPEEIQTVKIGGKAVTIMKGKLMI